MPLGASERDVSCRLAKEILQTLLPDDSKADSVEEEEDVQSLVVLALSSAREALSPARFAAPEVRVVLVAIFGREKEDEDEEEDDRERDIEEWREEDKEGEEDDESQLFSSVPHPGAVAFTTGTDAGTDGLVGDAADAFGFGAAVTAAKFPDIGTPR